MKRALLAFLIGCGSTPEPTDTFVAFASHFQGFHSWTSMPAVPPASADPGLHGTVPWRAYINRTPAKGMTSFPQGTIIVKETLEPDPTARKVFAMVKRGGGYNAQGATGWEFFELLNLPGDAPSIKWRGVGPPSGEMYGGDPNGCNGCHGGARGNDFVWTAGLSLSSF